MKLNCKPGDLAYITKSGSPNLGKIVTVIEKFDGRLSSTGRAYERVENAWIVEGGGLVIPGKLTPVPWHMVQDKYLRPIRDSDGEDETLTWAGKPERKEKETVE